MLSSFDIQRMEKLFDKADLDSEELQYYTPRIEGMYRHYQDEADRWARIIPKKKKEESLLPCGHGVGYHRTSTSGTRYCGKCKEVVG